MALNGDGTGTVNGYYIGPGADLRGADLRGADLERADLSKADLRHANLEGADLSEADLRGANCGYANLQSVNFRYTDAEGANLEKARLQFAHGRSAVFRGANFDGADLRYVFLEGADLSKADFSRADLSDSILNLAKCGEASFWYATLRKTRLLGVSASGASFNKCVCVEAVFIEATDATFESADLTGADLNQGKFRRVCFASANLSNVLARSCNLMEADFTDAVVEGADFEDANLKGALGTRASAVGMRSYGKMTGPILKIGKADSPTRAAEFKKRYPDEFERLKADTLGRDFTDSLRQSLRDKYLTPFEWAVTRSIYRPQDQRYGVAPNEVLLLNVNTENPEYTPRQRELLEKLSTVSRRSRHPHANPPFFTIGWVRYAKDDQHGVLLIEEVQSDVDVIRTRMKGDTEEIQQLRQAGIDPEEYVEVLELLRPYSSRFYEDAIGLVFQEAEALGYTVEMLGYEDKKAFGSPR
jgi:uncharacterized protein YjbI with pentapeptide repeats